MKKFLKILVGAETYNYLARAKFEFSIRNTSDFSSLEFRAHLRKLVGSQIGGFYVEVGANDGRSSSNTYWLEKERNWTGILIEPILHKHFESKNTRSKKNIFVYGALVDSEYKQDFLKMYYSNLMTTSELGGGVTKCY